MNKKSKWTLTPDERANLKPPINSYDNELVMSLAEFIKHPIAQRLLHNGQTYQVLGITNYSHWNDAKAMRACMAGDPATASHMADLAIKRLDRFMHVGTTDRLDESVAAAAAAMRFNLNHGQAYTASSAARKKAAAAAAAAKRRSLTGTHDNGPRSDHLSSDQLTAPAEFEFERRSLLADDATGLESDGFLEFEFEDGDGEFEFEFGHGVKPSRRMLAEAAGGNAVIQADSIFGGTLDKMMGRGSGGDSGSPKEESVSALHALGVEYIKCAARAQNLNLDRRFKSLTRISLKDGRRIVFNREARKSIPAEVIADLGARNAHDVRLHARAEEILNERSELWAGKGTLEALPPKTTVLGSAATKKRPLLTNGVPFPDGGNAPPTREKVT
ncbi:hypothetical protein FOA52_003575 [Chlamydomonas sp. UWO 241]|nr:hypothetical protein FOA52_003575 [Chlamydomonas sp. UWO 241]